MIYREHSHQKITDIKRLQKKHEKAIIQPRDQNGDINQAFLKSYGAGSLRITERDLKVMDKRNPKYARKLAQIYEYRNNQKS